MSFLLKGYDILTIPTDLDGTVEGFNMSRVNLSPGIKYYSNVIAYNYAGVHTTSTSDGFIVDHVDPSAGIVYDGLGMFMVPIDNFQIHVFSYTFPLLKYAFVIMAQKEPIIQ